MDFWRNQENLQGTERTLGGKNMETRNWDNIVKKLVDEQNGTKSGNGKA